MLRRGMYVRCPADYESQTDPRVFICAQVKEVGEFEETVTVESYDPFRLTSFFDDLPVGTLKFPINSVKRCRLFIGTNVIFNGQTFEVLAVKGSEEGFNKYYLRDRSKSEPVVVAEADLIASLTNGDVDPSQQLREYEFQNPAWYVGRSIVSKSMNILDNSINGFRELAGSKIRLLPHQVNTVLRCLQGSPCRFLLADEVGMGKTVEALSILKLFLRDNANTKTLIIVPTTLKEQWRIELLLKFNLVDGRSENANYVSIATVDELPSYNAVKEPWDFVIIDEAHRHIGNHRSYDLIHSLSEGSRNVLLLSATPVQQRREEYLDLLRLLDPKKYDAYSVEQFGKLLDLQSRIVQKTALILDDLDDYREELTSAIEEGSDPHDSEECEELFDEIVDRLEDVCSVIGDIKLKELLERVAFDSIDCGTEDLSVVIAYICSNYQIENSIIRNRRKLLESDDESTLLSHRELLEVTYPIDSDKNTYEALCYRLIMDWLENHRESVSVDEVIRPMLGAFFSSPWAFCAFLENDAREGAAFDSLLVESARQWAKEEDYILDSVVDILEDPFTYEKEYCTRIVSVLNSVYEDLYNQKIVLFTDYSETFSAYASALKKVFEPDEVSFFAAGMDPDELELQAYSFQNDSRCRIMLCDYTGGEGRNFQCADYVFHIDLPWDANQIEQRIGRLDRLERDPSRPIVTSVVVHTIDTFESSLFDFWNKGLKIFTQSLSGMEIIMGDINNEIESAVREDCRIGLADRIPTILKRTEAMRDTVRKEQNYDAAGFLFKPLFVELKRLIDYYTENENTLFADAMTGWASLAGFKGRKESQGIISYSANSFSHASAANSQLIPPSWDDYLASEQNRFVSKVQESYGIARGTRGQERTIRGTFLRGLALKSDYLHFFAPGDAVFDCIVNNAINSCKGRSAAFAARSKIRWIGLIFTWSIRPDESYLMDAGVSPYALSAYRGYMPSEQIVIPISIRNPDSLADGTIMREYQRLLGSGYQKNSFKHLGRRGGSKYEADGLSPIEQFRTTYPEDSWKQFVDRARSHAYKRASAAASRKSGVTRASEEMERALSARKAEAELYGTSSVEIEDLAKEQQAILHALANPTLLLDSAAYVRLT